MNVLKVDGIVKRFGDHVAVDHVDLTVNDQEIYGLLGPNGAGKSTTIHMICGLLTPNEGQIFIMGKDLHDKDVKKMLGVVPQDLAIYEELTALENVMFFGGLYGIKGDELKEKGEAALEFVGLKGQEKVHPAKFSGGMKRRLNIACALVHEPKLMIMDEPTVGIDPQSRNHILQSIKKLNEKGATIIYTSHYMEEVEAICSRVAIMDKGCVIAEGTQEELKEAYAKTSKVMIKVEHFDTIHQEDLLKIEGVLSVQVDHDLITIESNKEINNFDQIILYFTRNDIPIQNIERVMVNLETVFLNLTGKKLRN